MLRQQYAGQLVHGALALLTGKPSGRPPVLPQLFVLPVLLKERRPLLNHKTVRRNVRRVQRQHSQQRFFIGGGGLARQRAHQIDIDIHNPCLPQKLIAAQKIPVGVDAPQKTQLPLICRL